MGYHRRHGGGYTNYAVALAFTLLSTATVHAQPTADPAAATSTSVPDAATSTSVPAATTSTAGSAAATSTSVPQVVARGLSSGATAALIIGLVLAGCTIYGVVMYLKHQRLQDAALATRKLDSHDDSPPYIEAGRHGSDDFDAYFGKQPPLNGAAASHCVKFATARGAMLAPPHVAVDINLLRAKSTPAMLSSSMSKQDALPRVSMAAVDDTPNDTVTAMRSYRSMIQQTMGDSVDVAWMSPNLWTTSDVLAEIKDSKARRFVARLPVELKTRDPSEKDMEAVVAFARLTGDFSFLSLTDLRIMALTYMFERELHGIDHIRKTPKVSETKVTGPKIPASKVRCRYLQTPGGCRNGATCPFSHNLKDKAASTEPLPPIDAPCRYFNSDTGCNAGDACRFQHIKVDTPLVPTSTTSPDDASAHTTSLQVEAATVETLSPVQEVEALVESAALPPPAVGPLRNANVKSRILSAGFGASTNAGAEGDDGKNWVHNDNKAEYTHSPFGSGKLTQAIDANVVQVGCITTDYSMQNVLLQMGLHLISTDGMVINRVKQWVLKCAACYKTTTELDRQFCPVCGNNTMERIACSLDKDTEQLTLYTRANRPANLRGSKFSLPMPTGGRSGDLLLREDQLMHGIWAQRQKSSAKVLKSAFGEHVAHDLGVKAEKQTTITVGYGRMNPNSQKGRERRGKKKRHTD
ncbi:hypothetical protein DYB31_006779 [Aphanomyces astaci]|uniref:C3H1-type domain-containing protein n=3 Tax=Aphanomyces astaci TaxID=112090 RepID=A0A397EDT8_APHAT|nr:hypothetical protein DYB31_006779 [Aphanomyces astaci]